METKRGFGLRLTLSVANTVMSVLLLGGIAILSVGSHVPEHVFQPSASPIKDIAALTGGALVIAAFFAFLSKADRRCADDYAYQLMTSGAYVGMITMVIANVLWAIPVFQESLGIRDLRGQDMMAIGMIGWGVGYFTFRIRGLQ